MKRLFLLLLLVPCFLRADWDQLFSNDEDPSLFHHVNVITGNLNLSVQDGVAQGAKSLPLIRTYTSSGALEYSSQKLDVIHNTLQGGCPVHGGWNLFPHTNLVIEAAPKSKKIKAYLAEKSGNLIAYAYSHEESHSVIFLKPTLNVGQSSGSLSAKSNPQNNLLQLNLKTGECTLFLPDGGGRIYRGPKLKSKYSGKHYFHLATETLPSKHLIQYSYNDEKLLDHIAFTNPAGSKTYSWIHFDLFKTHPPFHFQVRTSNDKALNYRSINHKNRDYLSDVQSNCRPHEVANYTSGRKGIGARLQNLVLNGKFQFAASYYLPPNKKAESKWEEKPEKKDFNGDKVRCLEAPVGPNGEMVPIAHFLYYPGLTDVRDVNFCLTRYRHDSGHLTSIEYFNKEDHLTSTIQFTYEGSRLKTKAMLDDKGRPLFSKTFRYDSIGNVIEEILSGNLSGLSPHETYRKKYEYLPCFNVPILEEEENGLTYRYRYFHNTDLLTAKYTCDKEKIFLRSFLFYDQDHLLVAEVEDDGNAYDYNDTSNLTERRFKHYTLDPTTGLPKTITESYLDLHSGKEVVLKRTDLGYTPEKQINAEAIYDAEGSYRYTIRTEYDARGRLTLKTTPLGQENTYTYDPFGRLLETKEIGSPKKIFTYDPTGYPASCQEIGADGNLKTTLTQYDAKGRLLSQTDSKGNVTTQTYDAFGRCLQTRFPETLDEEGNPYFPIVTFTYDTQGNIASSTTPLDETTQTFYNTLRKPILIIQADGHEIHHTYNKNGTLAKTRYPDQTEIDYTYDLFQRKTSKTITSPDKQTLSVETWKYNAFHLLSYTDPQGLMITYYYDGAGRKIAEKAETRQKTYTYDSLGFLERTTEGDVSHIQIHDAAGRIAEEWFEESCGRKENHMVFTYDNKSNRKEKALRFTSQGEAIDLFAFDVEGRLIRHTDPHGEVNELIYDETVQNKLGQLVLQKTIRDPLGNSTIETYDALGHLVQLEKKNGEGATVSAEDYLYDKGGNKSKQISTVYLKDQPFKKTTLLWEYDSMGRVIKEVEADKKTTYYSYDNRGRLFKRTLPSGITLRYSYDSIDRLLELISSDTSIHYQFIYKQGRDPILSLDLVNNRQFERTYNLFGELLAENTPNFSLSWDYDAQGRRIQFTLPDRSSLAYSYTGTHLASVFRYSLQNDLLYEHRYTHFDENGRIAEESLINHLGVLQTTHDLLERPSFQTSPWMTHSISYGPSGLVLETRNSLLGPKAYSYDPLNQLSQENDQDHLFDSLGNPSQCQTNDCNQILSTPDSQISYDDDGNPIQQISSDKTTLYTYDALGRLTSITIPSYRKVHYEYDPFSRLLSKTTFAYQNGWVKEKTFLYLYDQENEIGLLNEQGTLIQLKVLGLGIKGDIGGAVAIELHNAIFAPLHDFNGNIIALIASDGQIAETYPLDAFGKEPPSSPLNPWRFCSKRSEENLIFFGLRFYSPSLGRWLTPDPFGFSDGPNLYLYTRNSPLNRLDLFGLSSEETFWQPKFELNIPIIKLPDTNQLIHCKANLNGVFIDCLVSCGHFHKLQFSPEELKVGKVNIPNHFSDLMPKDGMIFALTSLQGGINTKFSAFYEMCDSFIKKNPEGTLFIALYNPTEGFFNDIFRAMDEMDGKETLITALTRQFMVTIIDSLHKVNPQLLWFYNPFSEAGAIQNNAMKGMTPEQQALAKQHLVTYAIAPATPLSKKIGFETINIYSEKDRITKKYGLPYLNDLNYDIRILPCTSTWDQMSGYFADHAFLGNTYQNALKNQIDELRSKHGFYDGKIR